MEKYEPHMQGTGTLDAETLSWAISAMFGHEPIERVDGARDWVFASHAAIPRTYTFYSRSGDVPIFILRSMMHKLHKLRAQGNREHRRKLIARRQKRAAFRRKKRGVA